MAFPTGAVNGEAYASKYGTRYVYDSDRKAWTQQAAPLYGTTGHQGLTGPQGTTGSQGATGALGYTGLQGPTGEQGVTGYGSNDGIQGSTGLQGATGLAGGYGSATGIVGMTFDANDGYLVPGLQSNVKVPWAVTLDGWQVVAQETGYITMDVNKAAYSTWPGKTVMNSGDTGPYLNNAIKNEDTNLSGWASTSVSVGEYVQVLVTGVTGVKSATVSMMYHRG